MTKQKIKILICLAWLIGIVGVVFFQKPLKVIGKNNESESVVPKPDVNEIENFNRLILKRFLTEPGFGSARIQPFPPYSKHLESFHPKNESEKQAIEYFERNNWKVGLHLFGRTAYRNVKNGVEQKDFRIEYRFKQPVIITKNIKDGTELSHNNRMLKQVKEAFYQFQQSETAEKNDFEFNIGSWSYFAKPVRAVNQSCVSCHTDYVVVKKLEGNNYQFRKRKTGDVNGILVYAFQKVKK